MMIYPWTEDQVTNAKTEGTHSKDYTPYQLNFFLLREWATELEVNNSNILKATNWLLYNNILRITQAKSKHFH